MASGNFTAKIEHTEHTIELLYRARYHAYEKLRMLIRLIVGGALVFAAVFASFPLWVKAIMLLIGAWLLVSTDFPAQMQADRALQNRKADLPCMKYEFFPDRVAVSGEGRMTIGYKKFKKIVQDTDYLYLFTAPESVCMIDIETIRPKDAEEFKKFICNKTGLEWEKEKSFLSMSLYDFKAILRDRKRR